MDTGFSICFELSGLIWWRPDKVRHSTFPFAWGLSEKFHHPFAQKDPPCIIICSHFEAKKSWSTIFGPIFLKQRKANFLILFEILPLILFPSARRWKKSWNRKIEFSIATVYQTSSLLCAAKDWRLPLVLISILSARVFYIKTLAYSM